MYQAIYRKYRPKTFQELLGQYHITTTLKNQIKNENIGHAYLFSGTRGTGKTSAAKIFSRAVNCVDSKDGEPCNECRNCLEILAETTVDVVEMDAASHNGVNDIRELREKVIYPPTNIKKKVYIIDEVHMLSIPAFNALLKTLEEPPKHLIFILATTEPEKIPQTILSRCQRFDFKRIQVSDMVDNMTKITTELEIEIDIEVLKLIARNSDGAMRDALSLLDQCISFSDKKIEYEDALDLLGIVNTDIIFDMVESIKEKKLENALDLLETINQSGKDIGEFIKDLIGHFRNLMIIKSSKKPEAIIEIDNIDRFEVQAKDMSMDFILHALNILVDADNKGRWSGEIRLILEMAIIKMVDIEEELSLLERVKRLEQGFTPRKEVKKEIIKPKIAKPIEQSQPKQKESVIKKPLETVGKQDLETDKAGKSFGDLDLKTISDNWDNVLKEVKIKKVSLFALIREGKLKNFENNQLEISYGEGFGFHHDAINKEENKEIIEKIISKYFNMNIVISFSMGSILSDKSKEEKTDEEAIKEVIELFGEDIVEIN